MADTLAPTSGDPWLRREDGWLALGGADDTSPIGWWDDHSPIDLWDGTQSGQHVSGPDDDAWLSGAAEECGAEEGSPKAKAPEAPAAPERSGVGSWYQPAAPIVCNHRSLVADGRKRRQADGACNNAGQPAAVKVKQEVEQPTADTPMPPDHPPPWSTTAPPSSNESVSSSISYQPALVKVKREIKLEQAIADTPVSPDHPPPWHTTTCTSAATSSTAKAVGDTAAVAAEPLIHIDLSAVDFHHAIGKAGSGSAADCAADAGSLLIATDKSIENALQKSFDAEYDQDVTIIDAREMTESVAARTAKDICWRQRRDIKSFLRRAAAQLRVEDIEPAPAGQPGTSQYTEFRTAWESARNKRIRMVFHGTPAHNAQSIAQRGLDPTMRRGQAHGPGEYFGTDAATSLLYCQGGNTMLVFAVLMDESGLTTATGDAAPDGAIAGDDQLAHAMESVQVTSGLTVDEAQRPVRNGIVVVHRSSHQLPLFVVRFHIRAPGHWDPALPGRHSGRHFWRHSARVTRAPLAPLSVLPARDVYELLQHNRGPLAAEAKQQRPSMLQRTPHRQIFVERPPMAHRPRNGDRWKNSGGKNAVVVEWSDSEVRIERRYGRCTPRDNGQPIRFASYWLIDKRPNTQEARADCSPGTPPGRLVRGGFHTATVYVTEGHTHAHVASASAVSAVNVSQPHNPPVTQPPPSTTPQQQQRADRLGDALEQIQLEHALTRSRLESSQQSQSERDLDQMMVSDDDESEIFDSLECIV